MEVEMVLKTEENIAMQVDLCRFCLSTNRRTTSVQSVEYAFGLITDWEPTGGSRVCFECRAFLTRLLRFKVQAIQARQLLESAVSGDVLHCLSNLNYNTKNTFDECFCCTADVTTHSVYAPDVPIKSDDETDFEVFVEPAANEIESPGIDAEEISVLQVKAEDVKFEVNAVDKKERKKKKIKINKTASRKDRSKEKKQKKVLNKQLKNEKPPEQINTKLGYFKPEHYECEICGKVFQRRIHIYKHMQVHFLSTKSFLCETCGKHFTSRNNLIVHGLTHAPIEARPHACKMCKRKFITKDKLRNHMMFHDGVKKFQCDLCERRFWLEPDVKRHKKLRHGLLDQIKKPKFTRTKSLFKNERLYVDEATGLPKAEHPNKGKTKSKNPDGTMRFLETSKSCPNASDYQCNICGKKFKLRTNLDFHRVVHTGERPFKCDECGMTFKYNAGLWGHKITHTGVKAHQCTICGSSFTLKGNLNGHMKMHTNDKPYECDICGQRFPWRRNLRNHLRVHSK